MEDIEQVIRDYIMKEFKPETAFDSTSSLIGQGIIDSLAIFLLTGYIEERFKIKIKQEDIIMENFDSLNTIKDLIMAKLKSGS